MNSKVRILSSAQNSCAERLRAAVADGNTHKQEVAGSNENVPTTEVTPFEAEGSLRTEIRGITSRYSHSNVQIGANLRIVSIFRRHVRGGLRRRICSDRRLPFLLCGYGLEAVVYLANCLLSS